MRKNELNALEIGQRLKAARKKLEIQQKDMAASMKVAASYLCDVEKGKGNPGPEFFIRLAAQYKINLNYLFMGAPEMFIDGEGRVLEQEIDLDDDFDTIEKICWLMEYSYHIRTMVMNNINRALYDNRKIIENDIKKKKAKLIADKTD